MATKPGSWIDGAVLWQREPAALVEEWLGSGLDLLREEVPTFLMGGHSMRRACERAGVHRPQVDRLRGRDAGYDAVIRAALAVGAGDETMLDCADAMHGADAGYQTRAIDLLTGEMYCQLCLGMLTNPRIAPVEDLLAEDTMASSSEDTMASSSAMTMPLPTPPPMAWPGLI